MYIGFSNLLGHVDKSFVMIQPEIVIWYTHLVKRNFFGVFEKTIGSPDIM